MVWATEEEDPRPISIMAMTAAMPMMIPRQVNTDRMTFRRKACKAIRTVRYAAFMTLFDNQFCSSFAMTLPVRSTPDNLRDERIFGVGLGALDVLPDDHLLTLGDVVRHNGRVHPVRSPGLHLHRPNELAILQPDGTVGSLRLLIRLQELCSDAGGVALPLANRLP